MVRELVEEEAGGGDGGAGGGGAERRKRLVEVVELVQVEMVEVELVEEELVEEEAGGGRGWWRLRWCFGGRCRGAGGGVVEGGVGAGGGGGGRGWRGLCIECTLWVRVAGIVPCLCGVRSPGYQKVPGSIPS